MSAGANTDEKGLGQRLVEEARAFRAREQAYLEYVETAREALTSLIEQRIQDMRDAGVAGDSHDALLAQFRGLKARFAEVDAIGRSLLLLDQGDPMVWEEIQAAVNALMSIELEARAAQKRIALAAVIREFVGGHAVQMRTLQFDVEAFAAKRFHSLTGEVRETQARVFGRHDTFTHETLMERLIALGSTNIELLAQMGSPTILPTISGRKP